MRLKLLKLTAMLCFAVVTCSFTNVPVVTSPTASWKVHGISQNENQKPFKLFWITLSKIVYSHGCTIEVRTIISFEWNGNGTPVTNITQHIPQVYITCPDGGESSTSTNFARLDFSKQDANITELDITPTGIKAIDDVITDQNFLSDLKDDLNIEIEMQK